MIGALPTALCVNGKSHPIRSDFRVVLNIFEAFADGELTDSDKAYVCLKCLYRDLEAIPKGDIDEAIKKAFWFCDGGEIPKSGERETKLLDWKHDESMIFPAVNKVAGYEVRSCDYLHWWTFLGLFSEVGDGRLTTVLSIRRKLSEGKRLDKWEQEIYRNNRSLIDLEAEDDEEDKAFLDELLGKG